MLNPMNQRETPAANSSSTQQPRSVTQVLELGNLERTCSAPAATLFTNTGRRIYVIGDIDGRFRPRSNPYDLHNLGHPHPRDPLANKLQGVWAQPVKGLDRYTYTVETQAGKWNLLDADQFTQSYSSCRWDFTQSALSAVRLDYAALNEPVLFTRLTLTNNDGQTAHGSLRFTAVFDLQDAWFTRLGVKRNSGQSLTLNGERLLAVSHSAPESWAAVTGGPQGAQAEICAQAPSTGSLRYDFILQPGQSQEWTFAVAIESVHGPQGALQLVERCLPLADDFLSEKQRLYAELNARGPLLHTPDPELSAAFRLALANLQVLEAEQEPLGRYFYAGLEMFPFWFSNDGAYSMPGLLAGGFESALNHVLIGLRTQQNGRIPHQVSPSGRLVMGGNAQETPQWINSVWDVYRWSGSRAFLEECYPTVLQGLFDYTLRAIDSDQNGYPEGPGMVEVQDMGAEKLDSAAYTWSALLAVEKIAGVLQDTGTAERARRLAQRIHDNFERDWWDPASGTYAMSLHHRDKRQINTPHWAIITPLETGLASPQQAAQTLQVIRERFLNHWGLRHTNGVDERVWTLPNAVLSRAAYRYGEPELGFEMLRLNAATLKHGSTGMFHELVPEGASFIQLWSAATFISGVIEDLLGIRVNAGEHCLRLNPQIPKGWEFAAVEALHFGEHVVEVRVSQESVQLFHCSGPQALQAVCAGTTAYVAAGETQEWVLKPEEQK
jgi:glycogen debranching enzyme